MEIDVWMGATALPLFKFTITIDKVEVTRPFIRNPLNDISFDCLWLDDEGNYAGVIIFNVNVSDTSIQHYTSKIISSIVISGTAVEGIVIDNAVISSTMALTASDVLLELLKKNWVMWSKIGSMDFTIDKSNEAGTMPFEFGGWIHHLKKHGDKVIAYGDNGIAILRPAGIAYGMNTIMKTGIWGANAVCGNDYVHYFMNSDGDLYEYSDTIKKLGYKEFLSQLSHDAVMLYDEKTNAVYICDSSKGFIYREGSLGQGIAGITGLGDRNGTLVICSPSPLTTPPFEIETDIFDMGSRHSKSIHRVEIGSEPSLLEVCVYYRSDNYSDFSRTAWQGLDARGIAYINAFGTEFKIGVRLASWIIDYQYFEIDYINVIGEIHGH